LLKHGACAPTGKSVGSDFSFPQNGGRPGWGLKIRRFGLLLLRRVNPSVEVFVLRRVNPSVKVFVLRRVNPSVRINHDKFADRIIQYEGT
jgi:hypothetical protein